MISVADLNPNPCYPHLSWRDDNSAKLSGRSGARIETMMVGLGIIVKVTPFATIMALRVVNEREALWLV